MLQNAIKCYRHVIKCYIKCYKMLQNAIQNAWNAWVPPSILLNQGPSRLCRMVGCGHGHPARLARTGPCTGPWSWQGSAWPAGPSARSSGVHEIAKNVLFYKVCGIQFFGLFPEGPSWTQSGQASIFRALAVCPSALKCCQNYWFQALFSPAQFFKEKHNREKMLCCKASESSTVPFHIFC